MISQARRRSLLLFGLLTSAFSSGAIRAEEHDGWSLEPSLYVFLPGLTGTVGIGPIDVDLNTPSDAIWHINFAAMGGIRAGYGAWALTAEVLYGDLGWTRGEFNGSVRELIFEPTLSYRVYPWLEPLAGIRYDSLGGDVGGPFGQSHAVTQGWVDPIVGVNLRFPLSESVSLDVRGDIGGFGVGSKLTWQVFPYVRWRVAKAVALQAGYRVLSIDYEHGSGLERVRYDIIELGPQLGGAFPFDL